MIWERFSLKEKRGIVTGGGTGLGKGMATALVQAGAGFLVVGRRKDVLEKTAEELSRFGGPVVPWPADLSRMEDIPRVLDKAIGEFGRVDFLVNNAGTIRRAPVEEYTAPDWDQVLRTNLTGPFFLAQAVARWLIGAKRPGSIINISSLIAYLGGKNVPAYAASKAGINHVTKSMAAAWGQYGIRVNAIAPGWFGTELTEAVQKDRERKAEITARIPLGRWGDPLELGGAAVFLASDASSYMTGQTIIIDGGLLTS